MKLLADWVAPDGKFCYTDANGDEVGTDEGRLFVKNEGGQMTIDLNSHKIDRGLKGNEPVLFGHVICFEGVDLTLTDSSVGQTGAITGGNSSNDNYYNGGGIHYKDGNLILENISIKENSIEGNGGALCVINSNVVIRNANIINNNADCGGAFNVCHGCTVTLESGHIDNNTAYLIGGAIFIDYDCKIVVKGGTINNNKAETRDGGAIAVTQGTAENDIHIIEMYGGEINNNTAASDGGAIFVERENFEYRPSDHIFRMFGGIISGNKALEGRGGGIYWYGRDELVMTGGEISNNTAKYDGGGIYVTDTGDVYFGGDAVVKDNTDGDGNVDNVYLTEGVFINHAMEQVTGVPNRPLTDGANISISSAYAEYDDTLLISGPVSSFDMESLIYFTSDKSAFFVRGVYNEGGGAHTNQFHLTPWGHVGYPVIDTVSIENSQLISDISFDRAKQIITITAKNNTKSSFENISLDDLINYTFAEHAVQVVDMTSARNMINTNYYRVLSSANTYVVCTVNVEFPFVCENHKDDDRNLKCDICGEFVILHFNIKGYSNSGSYKTVVLHIPEAGTYSLIIAKYETGANGQRRFENAVVQDVTADCAKTVVAHLPDDFTFSSGDKIMLWSDMEGCIPKCEPYLVK